MFFIHRLLISNDYAIWHSDGQSWYPSLWTENCVGIKGTFSLKWFRSVIPRVWSWAPWWALKVLQGSHSKRRNSKYVQLHIYMHLFIYFNKR